MYTFATELWEALEDEFNLQPAYSGRGMSGAECVAVVGQVGDLLRFAAACQRTAAELDLPDEELLDKLAATVTSDHMGYDEVFYFPGVQLETTNDPPLEGNTDDRKS